jgi:hypothetical protein
VVVLAAQSMVAGCGVSARADTVGGWGGVGVVVGCWMLLLVVVFIKGPG